MAKHEAVIIGGAVADVLIRPVDAQAFTRSSTAADSIRLSSGGDALNEATVLSRLGRAPLLVTKLGNDGMADFLLAHCAREGVPVKAVREEGLDTAINAVLVDGSGERRFITNRSGSLRRLALEDILPILDSDAFADARLVCLASMFVSPMLGIDEMAQLFRCAHAAGKIVCADATRPKNGERLADVAPALRWLDYFFPNLDEARTLTGLDEPDAIADALLDAGVGTVAIKLGRRGCLVKNSAERHEIGSYPVLQCVDTTGAGDHFSASFIAALLEGQPLKRCGAFANAAASLCVEHLGATAAVLDRAKILRRRDQILNEPQRMNNDAEET